MDNVNHPSHYTEGEIECIDAIESSLGKEGFESYCTGNALKYIWRWKHKGGIEDLEKARWYITRIIRDSGADAYRFPPIDAIDTYCYADVVEKMQEELNEIKVEVLDGNMADALVESVDLEHVIESFRRCVGYSDDEIELARKNVIEKNRNRGYYGR